MSSPFENTINLGNDSQRIASISPIPKSKQRCPSKKRKATSSEDFKKQASLRKKSLKETTNSTTTKQKSILSYCSSKSTTFITISSDSLPFSHLRDLFIDSSSTKNMNAQIGKCLKNNFQTSYAKKTDRRSKRTNVNDKRT